MPALLPELLLLVGPVLAATNVLQELDPALYPLARCNDDTQANYYHETGTPQEKHNKARVMYCATLHLNISIYTALHHYMNFLADCGQLAGRGQVRLYRGVRQAVPGNAGLRCVVLDCRVQVASPELCTAQTSQTSASPAPQASPQTNNQSLEIF